MSDRSLSGDDLHRVQRADGPVIADVHVPPSKSIVNRALMCAALADGASEIRGIAPGDDTAAMIACLQQLGCGIGIRIEDDVLVTKDAPEVLSEAAPRTVADIEALMAAGVAG